MVRFLKKPMRPWTAITILIVASWITALLGPLSFLLLFLLGYGIYAYHQHWKALSLLVLLNPLTVFFIIGIADYCSGTPELHFMGLPNIETYNLDRSSRCFHRGGGCLVSDDEWVQIIPHNTALRLLSLVFGPASQTYDGPYPTKEDALNFISDAPSIPVDEFVRGKIVQEDTTVDIGADVARRLVDTFFLNAPLLEEDVPDDRFHVEVVAKVYRGRCLILRLCEQLDPSLGQEERDTDCMIFFDMDIKRPFAYFRIKGRRVVRFPPVTYWPVNEK